MYVVRIESFGYLHGDPPEAHLTVDLREHFRDPHVDPRMREMTAADMPVRLAVLHTPGVVTLVTAVSHAVKAFTLGPGGQDVRLAVGCAGGRHRAPVFAAAVSDQLRVMGFTVELAHRDLHRPVVDR